MILICIDGEATPLIGSVRSRSRVYRIGGVIHTILMLRRGNWRVRMRKVRTIGTRCSGIQLMAWRSVISIVHGEIISGLLVSAFYGQFRPGVLRSEYRAKTYRQKP